MSKHFNVTTLIQGGSIGSVPTTVQWYSGDDPLQAGSALLSAFAHHREVEERVPVIAQYRTLSATVTIIEEES